MTERSGPDRPAATAAEAFVRQLREHALVNEAQDLALGIRHLTIVHGQPETEDEMAQLQIVSESAWAITGDASTKSVSGGNDYLTATVHGDGAATAVDALQAFAETLNPGWWRISQSAQPF